MTPIPETPLKRACPELLREDGRHLVVSLDNREGGTLTLRWSRSKEEPIDVNLGELMAFASGQMEEAEPEPRATPKAPVATGPDCVAWDDLLSCVHTVAADNAPARVTLVNLVKHLRLYHSWLADDGGLEWEDYKERNQP